MANKKGTRFIQVPFLSIITNNYSTMKLPFINA